MSISDDRPEMIELIELSDLAWTIIDPVGEHESIERTWAAALPADWAPAEGIEELRTRLDEITDRLRTTGDGVLLKVVSAVTVYLAARPDRRRVEQAVIGEALHERYGEDVPVQIAEWLRRQPSRSARARRHGAPAPRRHFHARPVAPEGG
jgi:hypothetical protein